MRVLFKPRTQKPSRPVRINWAHPLANKIAFYNYETVGATFYDAVTGKMCGSAGGQTVGNSTDYNGGNGRNLFFDGSTGKTTSTSISNPGAVTGEFVTTFARIKLTTKPVGGFTVAAGYANAGVRGGAWIGFDTSGFAMGGVFTSNGANTGTPATSVDLTNTWVNLGGASFDAGPNGQVWVNGVPGTPFFNGAVSGAPAVAQSFMGHDPANYNQYFAGEIALHVGWNRLLTDVEHLSMAKNPWQILLPIRDTTPVHMSAAATATAYVLVAAQGAYVLTGKAAGVLTGRLLAAAQGAYSLTGQAAGLYRGLKVAAAQGAYALTGQAVGFIRSYVLAAAQGAYALTGKAAGLLRALKMSAVQGSYSLAGQAVNFLKGRTLIAAQGTYALTGQAVNFSRSYVLAAAQGAYALTGKAVNFLRTYKLAAAQGVYTLAGQAVAFLRPGAYVLLAATGFFTLSGQAAGLLRALKLTAAQGSYVLTGRAVNLLRGLKVTAVQGSYVLAGQAAGFLRGLRVAAAQGTYSLAGQAVGLYRGRILSAAQGAYAFTGRAVNFSRNYILLAGQGTYTLVGRAVTLVFQSLVVFGISPMYYIEKVSKLGARSHTLTPAERKRTLDPKL